MQLNEKMVNQNTQKRITGQGMTEYIIIVAMIALAAIVAVGTFGGVVKDQFASMATDLSGGNGAAVTAATVATGASTLKTYTE